MKINEIKAVSILTPSKLPGVDFVINPYVGCSHACVYCYARFMKRFFNHDEAWGDFVDLKINSPKLIPSATNKYRNKSVLLSSVTDPYQALEKKHELTRRILEKLIPLQPNLSILTKSPLVLRDIDLLKQFHQCKVAISLSITQNETFRKVIEPCTSSEASRIDTLKQLHASKIKTILFASPLFPELSDWQALIQKTCLFVSEYWFENLHLYPATKRALHTALKDYDPYFLQKLLRFDRSDYWKIEEKKIQAYCRERQIPHEIYFHH